MVVWSTWSAAIFRSVRAGFRYASADQGSFLVIPCQAGACRIKNIGAGGQQSRPPQYFYPQLVRHFSAMVASERSPRLAMRLPCLRCLTCSPCCRGHLEVLGGHAPIVCHFLSRLDLPGFPFDRHLADLPESPTRCALVHHPWGSGLQSCSPASPCTPFLSGLPLLSPNLWVCCGQADLLNDDRCGRAESIICFGSRIAACSRPSSSEAASAAFDLCSRNFTRTRQP